MMEDMKKERHSMWFGVAAFSTIALVAMTTDIPDGQDLGDQTKELKWSVSAASVVVGLSALAWFAHFTKDRFAGTPVEGGLALIALGFWAACLPTIMKPGHQIAINRFGGIQNPNLYFFSWGAFLATLAVFVGFMKDVYKLGMPNKDTNFSTGRWATLMATSFVLMASSSRLWKNSIKDVCDDDDDLDICKRTKLAVSIGTISGFISLVWMVVGPKMPKFIDNILSVFILAMWCFGVAYITFDEGPGTEIGNIFFSTWGSFAISALLCSDGVHSLLGMYTNEENTEEGESNKPAEDKPVVEQANAPMDEENQVVTE